jgi:folate-binding protein YgfZ
VLYALVNDSIKPHFREKPKIYFTEGYDMQLFLSELPNSKVITLSGEQRDEYLHGQITIDTKHFDNSHARLAAHCDFKGKMWSNFVLTQCGESYHLVMPESASTESLAQLKKYGVFSKVEIDTLNEDYYVLGGTGEQLKQDLQSIFGDINEQHLSHCKNKFGEVITFNDTSLRYLVVLHKDGFSKLRTLAKNYLQKHSAAWNMLEIEAGLGFVENDTIGEFVPQMLNLQMLDGIDFNKGCYMGQEVVARTKFLGKNKRALYILQASPSQGDDDVNHSQSTAIVPGDILEKSVGENWRRGGTVIKSANVAGITKILAVLANDTEVDDVLRLKSNGKTFSVMPLPY